MSTLEDIEQAVKIFKNNFCDFELMHCVSTYPCKPEDVNLNVIDSLKKKFNCKVGYSGHENGVVISLAAFVKGVSSIERHITLDRTMYGSDQSASLEIRGMNELVSGIKKIKIALGNDEIGKINEDEKNSTKIKKTFDDLMNDLKNSITKSIQLKNKLLSLEGDINKSINLIFKTIKSNNKVLICGNGGSAAEAQHFAAEFLIRLNPKINRKSLPMISLALDTSTITACGNDYSFNEIFSRSLEGIGLKGDLLLCLSTTGNSANIIKVLKKAREKKLSLCPF